MLFVMKDFKFVVIDALNQFMTILKISYIASLTNIDPTIQYYLFRSNLKTILKIN
jgi:hypothetical protein